MAKKIRVNVHATATGFDKTTKAIQRLKKAAFEFQSMAKRGGWVNPADSMLEQIRRKSPKVKAAAQDMGDAVNKAIGKKDTRSYKKFMQEVVGGDIMKKASTQATKPMQNIDSWWNKITNNGKKAAKQVKSFRMEYLSTMFFGMQVWRTFGGFFRDMIQNYKDLDKKGNKPLTRALTKLSASFTFLKFSILDAMGPSLTNIIIKFADAMLWLADADPALLEKIGYAIGIIAIAGLGMFVASQVKLFIDAVGGLITLSGLKAANISGIGTALGKLGSKLKDFAGTGLGKTISVGIGAVLVWEGIKDFKDIFEIDGNSIFDRLKASFKLALGGAMIGWAFGPAGAVTGFVLGLGVSVILNLLDIAWEHGIDEKLIAYGTALKNYIYSFFTTDKWKSLTFSAEAVLDLDTKTLTGGGEKKGLGERLISFFSPKPYIDEVKAELENLSQIASPEAIKDMKEMVDNGDLGKISESLKTEVNPQMGTFNETLETANETMSGMIDSFENWTPSDKTINVYYVEHGKPGGLENETQL